MKAVKPLLAQVVAFVPWASFMRIVHRRGSDSGVRALSCAEQFRVVSLAPPT